MYSWHILFTGRISSEMVCLLKPPPFSLPPPLPLPEAYMKFRQSHTPDQREEKDKRDGPAFPLLQSGLNSGKGEGF